MPVGGILFCHMRVSLSFDYLARRHALQVLCFVHRWLSLIAYFVQCLISSQFAIIWCDRLYNDSKQILVNSGSRRQYDLMRKQSRAAIVRTYIVQAASYFIPMDPRGLVAYLVDQCFEPWLRRRNNPFRSDRELLPANTSLPDFVNENRDCTFFP